MVLTMGGCTAKAPSGQVVATVDGKEVTDQDLSSEARASGAGDHQDPRILLQRVIARVLLADAAHARKLDAYPGYPSDIIRLQQSFLAEKTLQEAVKPPAPPSSAEVAAFIAAHPYAFGNRMRIHLDEIRFQTTDNLNSVSGAVDLPALVSRLKSLSTPFARETRLVDTAQLPAPMADKIATAPIGQLLLLRQGNDALAIVVDDRQPIELAPDQQAAVAGQLLSTVASQREINAEVTRLRARAKIIYQRGYSPSGAAAAAQGSTSAPAAAASTVPTGG